MTGRLIDSTGTRRRREALGWCGWTRDDLARVTGTYVPRRRGYGPRVTVETAAAMARAFDLLWNVTPPDTPDNDQARRIAQRLGWAPPLAWDDEDLDDPNATPQGLPDAPVRLSIARQTAELLDLGYSVTEIPARVGKTSLSSVLGAIRDPQLRAELTRRAAS